MTKHIVRIVLGLIVTAVLIGHAARVYHLTVIAHQDAFFYDARVRATAPGGIDERIVIVDIDEKSLGELGRWPWGRDRIAGIVRELFDHYAVAVVGFDVVFAEPDESSGLSVMERIGQRELRNNTAFHEALGSLRHSLDYDRVFAETLKGRPVVLGYYFSNQNVAASVGQLPPPVLPAGTFAGRNVAITQWSGYGANLPPLQQAAASGGHFVPIIDFDGVTRRVPLVVEHAGAYYEALSLAVVRTMLGNPPLKAGLVDSGGKNYGGLEWFDIETARGALRLPVDEFAAALVPYRGEQGSFRYVSAADVLHKRLPVEALSGKIIVVGTSAPGLLDLRSTPVGSTFPGVEVHTNVIAGMLDGTIKEKPRYMIGAEVAVLVLVGAILSFLLPIFSPVRGMLLSGAVLASFIAINMSLWASGLVLPMAATLWLIALLFTLNTAWGYLIEARTKRQFTDLFGQYVPPELVDEMAKAPESYTMDGRNEELTVLFSDVVGFTTLSEGLDPKDLAALMNEYLSAMTEVIRRERGTLDKYIGDAIMAFWGAPVADPEHARHALRAAMAMRAALGGLGERFRQRGWPVLDIGIGINTGTMTVGDMGSRVRKAYTVMGDPVNLASRLEGLTRVYGVGVVVSETVKAALPDFAFRELDRVRAKGKTEPVAIYEPLGPIDEQSKEIRDGLRLWNDVLRAYRAKDWDQADVALLNVARTCGEQRLFKLYADRVSRLRQNPPPDDWDGVTTFETK
ncbi:MAG TPA: adenylate/guanylate cyclase domain-containing protein [Rhodocyclaceae bacterium]